MYKALHVDVTRVGTSELRDRYALFARALTEHMECLSRYELVAWWFVLVLTHAAGSWGDVHGLDYFHDWIDDQEMGVLEALLTNDTRHWTHDETMSCLDELDLAIRYRQAMLDMLRES